MPKLIKSVTSAINIVQHGDIIDRIECEEGDLNHSASGKSLAISSVRRAGKGTNGHQLMSGHQFQGGQERFVLPAKNPRVSAFVIFWR
jgi:hypothetical protein